jgi:hypothetical protein
MMDEEALKAFLSKLKPHARDALRRLMRADSVERNAFAQVLLRLDTPSSRDLADLADLATLNPDFRRKTARFIAEIEADSCNEVDLGC